MIVLGIVMVIARFAKGFLANIAVLLGIIAGGVIAAALGMMHFDKIAEAAWFAPITPFHFGTPIFEPVLIATMTLVMIVTPDRVRPACSSRSRHHRHRSSRQPRLSAGLRMDGLGTIIGGVFNTFPYTSFSQNVGLVGVTGVRSRYVCVAGGAIMVVLGLIPKMGALVEALPTVVLGGAGIVMFGMVAATGIRILHRVDFVGQPQQPLHRRDLDRPRDDPAGGAGLQDVAAARHPPADRLGASSSTALGSVLLNLFFNGAKAVSEEDLREAAIAGGEH